MTEAPQTRSASSCYRHPERPSWVLCQRCGRTICPDCQTQAAVGVHCPECTREARQSIPQRRPSMARAIRTGRRISSGAPVVTWSLIAISVIVFVLNELSSDALNQTLWYRPVLTLFAPWTMLTATVAHASFLHLAVNMLSLWVLGPMLEHMVGRARFLGLYLLAGLGGSVAVLWLSEPLVPVVGASGAIFGLLGALFVIQRGLGGNSTQLVVVIVLNLAIGFFVSGISWQAHVGGLVTGALVALVYMRTRKRQQRPLQAALVAGVALLLVLLTVARFVLA
nr:rhomboid family intramembrane serine protease [Salinibacterium sp. ZJ454]